jgi:hypothetical protein
MRKILYASLLLAVVSCKKKDESINTNTPTQEQLVGTYRQTGETETYGGTTVNTWTSTYYEPCEMDNTLTLNSNNTYVFTDAGTQCNPPQNMSGNWSVNGNQITVLGSPATINNFDGTNLVVQTTQSVNGSNLVTTVTLTKQ